VRWSRAWSDGLEVRRGSRARLVQQLQELVGCDRPARSGETAVQPPHDSQKAGRRRRENAGCDPGGSRGKGERFDLLRRRPATVLRPCESLKTRAAILTES
jgi:hypothetical protein